jgi:uncharacterized repeat protein (TIGR01451 family)
MGLLILSTGCLWGWTPPAIARCDIGGGTIDTAIVPVVSPEVYGTTAAARLAVDNLDNDWRTIVGLPQTGTVQSVFGTATGAIANNSPNLFSMNGVTVDVALVNLAPSGSCTGTVNSGSSPQLTQSPTLQSSSPRPASLFDSLGNHPSYWNENVGSSASRNGILLTFSQPIAAFGAWFGDLETRTDGNGTPAILRLLDVAGNRIGSDIPITPTTLSNGGTFAAIDQSQCGITASARGCGNNATRWIGFVDPMARVKQVLVIVGDDDFGDVGNTEHLSFIGANIVSAIASSPNILLVKRITAINGNRIQNPNDNTPLNRFVDDTTSSKAADDNNSNWLPNYLTGSIDAGKVKPGDNIEYTIYFLSAGGKPITNANICDGIPPHTTFVPDAYGPGTGIQLAIGSTISTLTNVPDSDRGDFFNVGATVPDRYPNGTTTNLNCATPTGTEGAVVVNLVNNALASPNNELPNATAAGTPSNSYGFVRFVSKVN